MSEPRFRTADVVRRLGIEPIGRDDPNPNGTQPVDGRRLISLQELRVEPEAAVEWLLEGVLPKGGLSLLAAPPKLGKSTLARCLISSTAAGGGTWLGRTVEGGPVIHLCLEERRTTVRAHYDGISAPGDAIHLFFGPAPAPGDRMATLERWVQEVEPALVVIDPLQRWVRLADGNSYSEVTDALTPLIDLAHRSGAHITLVHHSRKGGGSHGEEVLGSQGLYGSVDTLLSLSRDGDRRMFYASGRDGVEIEKMTLTMDARGWVDVGASKREADQADLARRIFEWLADQDEPVTRDQVRRGVRVDGGARLVKALQQLAEDRDIVTTGRGVRGDPMLYSIPNSKLDP